MNYDGALVDRIELVRPEPPTAHWLPRNRVGCVYAHPIGLVRPGFVSVRDAEFEHVGGDSSEGNDAMGGLLVIQQKRYFTRYHSTGSLSAITGLPIVERTT
ncbi:MAG TPA: hypothetical protein VK579_06275 [Terriglobales bacterium]|nr:hypothetical protein [Terriglobales bacterium]